MYAFFKLFFHTSRERHEDIPFHSHQCYELVYYLQGKGKTLLGKTEYAYQPGQFTFIKPNTLHNELHHEVTEVMFVGFSSEVSPRLSEGIFSDFPGKPILALLKRMAIEMQQKQRNYMDMLNVLVSEMLIMLERIDNLTSPEQQIYKIQFAQSFIDENFSQKIDFSSLSKQSGYSYDRFRHLFKDLIGCSPSNYILHKRLQHAKMLLSETKMKNAFIALECGFSNEAQFCSLFKRETGVTPGDYRRQSGT